MASGEYCQSGLYQNQQTNKNQWGTPISARGQDSRILKAPWLSDGKFCYHPSAERRRPSVTESRWAHLNPQLPCFPLTAASPELGKGVIKPRYRAPGFIWQFEGCGLKGALSCFGFILFFFFTPFRSKWSLWNTHAHPHHFIRRQNKLIKICEILFVCLLKLQITSKDVRRWFYITTHRKVVYSALDPPWVHDVHYSPGLAIVDPVCKSAAPLLVIVSGGTKEGPRGVGTLMVDYYYWELYVKINCFRRVGGDN